MALSSVREGLELQAQNFNNQYASGAGSFPHQGGGANSNVGGDA